MALLYWSLLKVFYSHNIHWCKWVSFYIKYYSSNLIESWTFSYKIHSINRWYFAFHGRFPIKILNENYFSTLAFNSIMVNHFRHPAFTMQHTIKIFSMDVIMWMIIFYPLKFLPTLRSPQMTCKVHVLLREVLTANKVI